MGYERLDDGRVQLTLTADDYTLLTLALGFAAGAALRSPEGILTFNSLLGLVNRINEGNPHFTPYEVEAAHA